MSWYKKAKKEYTDYQEIAHGHDKIYYVWVIIDGKFKMEPNWKDGVAFDHYGLFGSSVSEDDYKGRFNSETKEVSIVNPKEGRPIPNFILKILYDNLGDDIKVYEFY